MIPREWWKWFIWRDVAVYVILLEATIIWALW
jgi:hypothetical protein